MIDGRNVDVSLGTLLGEGALQKVEHLAPEKPYARIPEKPEEPSYYGLPLLKETVWKWPIPTYLFVGGAAGASALLGAMALLQPRLQALSRKTRWIAAGGAAVSAGLLIEDLGIRRRFIYMMRVFRPSSPMNVGTWILAAFSAASGASLLPGAAGDAAAMAAGVAGLPLCGYTGVLLANTAVPLWQEARSFLPPLFCASAAASAASVLEMTALDGAAEPAVRRLAIFGKAAELAADFALEQRVSRIERVGRPLHVSLSGALWKAAKVCTVASLLLSLIPRKSRALRFAAGALGAAGALATRFGLFHGGKASARDPQAVFAQQGGGSVQLPNEAP